MQTKIIIGYDGSEDSQDALALGLVLAAATNAELMLAAVYPHSRVPGKGDAGAYESIMASDMRAVLDAAEVPEGTALRAVPATSVSHGLHDLAEDEHAQIVVLGSRGSREISSDSQRLLQGAPCAIAVAPAGFREHGGPIGRVIVGYDGAGEAEAALDTGIALARELGAALRVISALEHLGGLSMVGYGAGQAAIAHELRSAAEDTLATALGAVPDDIEHSGAVVDGEAADVLREESDGPSDLVVVGSRAYGRLGQVLLGSVSGGLVRNPKMPVLAMPRGERIELVSEPPGRARERDLA